MSSLSLLTSVQIQAVTLMVILQVFQHLWGTSELLSSFDSINVLRPGSHVVSTDDWLHCDQAPSRRGTACIQGILNMVDVGPDIGKHGRNLATPVIMS